jgi:hypothetical protein
MTDLAGRLQAVEDRLAIIELEGTYARSFDDHDGDTWSSLFTPEGVYQARVVGGSRRKGSYVAGTEELRRFCTDAPFTGIHFLHLPQITLGAESATSRVHLEFYGSFSDEGAPFSKTVGYYDVAYQRCDERWLMVRRVTTTFASESRATFGYVMGSGLDS